MPYKDPQTRRLYHVAYRAAHREERRTYGLAYNAPRRQEQRAYAIAYHASHRADHSAHSANKRATRFGAAGLLAGDDIRNLWERQPVCVSCGDGQGVDHIIAFADGGLNVPGNLQTMCKPCNVAKEAAARSLRPQPQMPHSEETKAKIKATAIALWSDPSNRERYARMSRRGICARWHVGRSKPCVCGTHATDAKVVG